MVKIGMMIGNRYEILEKIGTGGMSDVYKAKCHKLNRFVAVKVLKQEFSENENFVSKFRIEAQAAAGLMHPNIVNVYDVGEENNIYYIVMELVEGITLKKYIEKKARLSYKEAVSIAIQVSMGIEVAHNNHIIHRDIKPQNIIISKDGKVKVTDFGIAKAATSNTITSNVMGSVHYTSPEQARGGYSDEKSDIYSLGITMFEMLTGRVPFNGETTVAIAIKHIQEELPSPKEYVPEIPAGVDAIVLKCCQKSPDRRYQSMQEVIADLKQSLMSPDEDFVVSAEPELLGETRSISQSEMEEIKQRTAYHEDTVSRDSMRLRTEVEDYPEGDESYEGESEEYAESKMEKMTIIMAIVIGVVICLVLVFLAIRAFRNFGDQGIGEGEGPIRTESSVVQEGDNEDREQTVSMPPVVGEKVENARNKLNALGIFTEVNYQESNDIDAGVVISADVLEGADIIVGSTVTLVASAGPEGIEIPGTVGDTYEEAHSKLVGCGFTVTRMEAYSNTVDAGVVAAQMPVGGSKAPKGTDITLTVSLGKENVKQKVPLVLGYTEQDGTVIMIENKLEIGDISYEYSSEYAEGLICYQSYSEGTYVDQGTKIDIKISLGEEPKVTTYKFNASIAAPSQAEAPDYVSGTAVAIKLVTDTNQVLLETETSSFPYSGNYYNLSASGGTITMTYTVTTPSTTTTDEEGNTVTVPGTTEKKSFTRRVEFTAE